MREGGGLTNSSAISLQSHAAVLLLQVLVAKEDPGRVVSRVESNRSSEVGYGFVVVPTETVEIT